MIRSGSRFLAKPRGFSAYERWQKLERWVFISPDDKKQLQDPNDSGLKQQW